MPESEAIARTGELRTCRGLAGSPGAGTGAGRYRDRAFLPARARLGRGGSDGRRRGTAGRGGSPGDRRRAHPHRGQPPSSRVEPPVCGPRAHGRRDHGGILLLGVGHGSDTCLHLAEHHVPGMARAECGAALRQAGRRRWVRHTDVRHLDSDALFPALGQDYEGIHPPPRGRVGSADARPLPVRALVDFAVPWISRHIAERP